MNTLADGFSLSCVFGLLFLPNDPEKVFLKGMGLKRKEDNYQEGRERALPVKSSVSPPMLIGQSGGKKVSGMSYTRQGSIPYGRGEVQPTASRC